MAVETLTSPAPPAPAQASHLLEARELNQFYGGSHILRNVSLQAASGQVTAILGRNGVGKTTLLKSLMGIVPIRSGVIEFNGQDMTKLPVYDRVRRGIGYVPQGREIFARLTVDENLRMGLAGAPRGATIPEELFEFFPVLKQMQHRRGGDLSGGQQQQLAIARALAGQPRLLLLDEPTEGIQPSIIKEIGRVIQMLARCKHMAIVLVEQYFDFAAELADTYIVLERGSVIAQGDRATVGAAQTRALLSI